MAFSDSPLTVQRMLTYLMPLIEGRETTWRVDAGKARWFAYRIREALFAARSNADIYPELAAARYRVEVLSSREVRAVQRPALLQVEVDSEPLQRPEAARVQTQKNVTLEQLQHAWDDAEEAGKLYFPNAGLSAEDLLQFHDWTVARGLMFFENAGAITLMQADSAMLEYAWSPSDLQQEWKDDA